MIKTFLDDVPAIDWDDFEEAGRVTKQIVRQLAADKATLRKLVFDIENKPELLQKCERHQLLDKLVIYEGLDRGLRIRIHFSTEYHLDRPHDHRWPFTTLLLRGQYRHHWHRANGPVSDGSTPDDMRPLYVTDEKAGACYTLHDTSVHTTYTTPDTVSLFLRGTTQKQRSIITDRESGKVWWRYGEHEETPERRQAKIMPVAFYRELRERLERFDII